MWYFAYGSNLNSRAVGEWCRHFGHKHPALKPGRPAILDNYRLGFPIFSEYWGGGIADIVYDPGKYVMGVLFDLAESDLGGLDLRGARRGEGGGAGRSPASSTTPGSTSWACCSTWRRATWGCWT